MTEHQEYIKLPLLNARRSAALGWWLVALPCFFLAAVVMRYHFHAGIRFFDNFFDAFSTLDRAHGWWFSPLLFLLLPLIAAAMNLLSILHVAYSKTTNELTISLKVRFWNIALILIGFGIALVVSFYAISEHISERTIQRHLHELRQLQNQK